MKKKQIITFILLVLVLLVFNKLFMSGYVKTPVRLDTALMVNSEEVTPQKLFDRSWKTIKNDYYDPTMNNQDWSRWYSRYRGKIKTEDDAKVAINTILASLDDPYSKFMTKAEYSEQNTSIASKISGIGVNITSISGKTYIISVIEGTPAYYAKLQSGDIILTIDGKDASGMSVSEVASLVRGPENSVVELTILRKKTKILKAIKRKEINIKTVRSTNDKNLGYIQILSFISTTTPNEFLEALENTQNAEGLILDLRGNTGGLLPNATFIANMFITNGTLVSIVGRNGYRRTVKAQHGDFGIDKPMIVLINGTSASASEILSGALKDYKKATLVGEKTFGKGMVQKIIALPNETGINLTIAKYLTPLGHDINKKGITPDIVLKPTESDILARSDTQLEQAKILLQKMIEKN